MGSRLAVLAAVVGLGAGTAVAQPKNKEAAELHKTGIAAYKAKKYAEAASAFERSYRLDASPDTLFAWAQAERLLGDCDTAIPLYKKLLEQTSDLNGGRLVRENLALCEPAAKPPEKDPKPEPKPAKPAKLEPEREPPPAKVTTITKTSGTDGLTVALFAGGTLAVGASVAFFLASSSTADAAADARTYDDYRRLNDKADTQRAIAIGAGAGGAVLVGLGVFRVVTKKSTTTETTDVGITTTGGRTTFWVTGSF